MSFEFIFEPQVLKQHWWELGFKDTDFPPKANFEFKFLCVSLELGFQSSTP
jgi:hypothetical protein